VDKEAWATSFAFVESQMVRADNIKQQKPMFKNCRLPHGNASSITRRSELGGPARKACRGDLESLFSFVWNLARKSRENAKIENKVRRKKALQGHSHR